MTRKDSQQKTEIKSRLAVAKKNFFLLGYCN